MPELLALEPIPLLFAGKLGVQPQVTDLLHAVSLVGMWIRILINLLESFTFVI